MSDPVVVRFAELMRDRYGADIYLFGSRSRGDHHVESDYDLVAVAPAFAGQRRMHRGLDRFDLWDEAGGRLLSLDLHCYTPEEFAQELDSLGYLGEADERGELMKIPAPARDVA
jgi:predicted nucleotidyltransferase